MQRNGHICEIQNIIILIPLGETVQVLHLNVYTLGCGIMNYNKYGWYYNNGNDKSASWSGVEYLYNFLINNKGIGPYAKEVGLSDTEVGDIAQLNFDGNKFSHTLIIVDEVNPVSLSTTFVATHTFDSYGRSIASYNFQKIRCLHIECNG